MADIKTKEKRSLNMAAIKSKDTKPEMIVRRFLHAAGYRYRLHDRKLPGCPDLVFPSLHTVIFVHGCFWHGHENCKYYRMPKSNVEFWYKKINCNIQRDIEVRTKLEEQSWKVIVIWECELKNKSHREAILESVIKELSVIRHDMYSHPKYESPQAAEPAASYQVNRNLK